MAGGYRRALRLPQPVRGRRCSAAAHLPLVGLDPVAGDREGGVVHRRRHGGPLGRARQRVVVVPDGAQGVVERRDPLQEQPDVGPELGRGRLGGALELSAAGSGGSVEFKDVMLHGY